MCELILFGLELDPEAFIDDPPNSDAPSFVQSTQTSFDPAVPPSETTPKSAESGSLQTTQPLESYETSALPADDVTVEQSHSFSQNSVLDSTSIAVTPNRFRAGPSVPFLKRQYMRADKYIRALEKALQVVSTVDPLESTIHLL